MVSVDVKHHVYLVEVSLEKESRRTSVKESVVSVSRLCESDRRFAIAVLFR